MSLHTEGMVPDMGQFSSALQLWNKGTVSQSCGPSCVKKPQKLLAVGTGALTR